MSDEYRNWWVWVNEGRERDGEWHSVGMYGGYYTADEAIQVAIRHYDHPVWAFALDKGPYGAYYNLHYPEGVERRLPPTRADFAPSGYVAALGEQEKP
jgi:hypothetical protein